jgi:DNA-binding IclR family transcriptional regulator
MDNTLMDNSPKVAGTAAFSKFMAVLQAVADAPSPPLIGDLVRACGYPRPTVYRIVAALVEQGMVTETAVPGGAGAFSLGPTLIQLASRAWSQLDLRVALADDLQALRDETGETVHLSVPAGREMVYVDKLESQGPVRMASRVGGRLSLHSSAAGKAYMAALPGPASDELVSKLTLTGFMPNTITQAQALLDELARVRRRGYAVDNEENERGIVCYGVAIAGAAGQPLACVSVSTLQYRQNGAPASRYIAPLLRLREAAAAKLGAWPGQAGAPSHREDT